VSAGTVKCSLFSSCGGVKNPKSEARNSKQFPMIEIQMTKTARRGVSFLNIGALVF
jgi:hypothetical protein